MSLVTDFMNTHIAYFSHFPGSPCSGKAKSGRMEFQSDAVIAMEEADSGDCDFVVLRFYLSENSDGALEASLSLIFTETVNDEMQENEFFLPINRESDLAAMVRRCLATSCVSEPLEGEALKLTHTIEAMRREFNDRIAFNDPVVSADIVIH